MLTKLFEVDDNNSCVLRNIINIIVIRNNNKYFTQNIKYNYTNNNSNITYMTN